MSFPSHEPEFGLKTLDNEEYLQRVNTTLDILLKKDTNPDTTVFGIVQKAIWIADELDRQLTERQLNQLPTETKEPTENW